MNSTSCVRSGQQLYVCIHINKPSKEVKNVYMYLFMWDIFAFCQKDCKHKETKGEEFYPNELV